MYTHRYLFSILILISLILAACGGVTDPQLGSISAQPGTAGDETATPTIAPNTPTPQSEAATSSEQSGSSSALNPSPTAAADPTKPASSETATAMDPNMLMQSIMSTPGAMDCIANELGMMTLMQLTSRLPTAEEMTTLQSCLTDG